jgi:hypothetical protein
LFIDSATYTGSAQAHAKTLIKGVEFLGERRRGHTWARHAMTFDI